MKRLIKVSIILFLLLPGTDSFAQWYGIKGGYNLSRIITKNDAGDHSSLYTNKEGFHVGFSMQIPVKGSLALETGLMVSTKGYLANYESTYQSAPVNINLKSTLTYLEAPVMAKVSIGLGEAKISGLFGPYLGIGLDGDSKKAMTIISSGLTTNTSYNLKWGSDKGVDNIRRVDLGLKAGAGIEFSKIILGFTYGMGLRNWSLLSSNNTISKNRGLEFSMTYKISYGSFSSPDYEERIKAVKRSHKQTKLMKVALEDKDLRVRVAAFNKLNDNSLSEISNSNRDPALILAAKIRLHQTQWRDEFDKGSAAGNSLGDVIGAAALVTDPSPSSYDVVSACHKYIRQGDVSRIPELRNLLMRFGDLSLAEDYLNCGNDELHSAGADWGSSHGYNIRSGNGSNRVRWGENKNQ